MNIPLNSIPNPWFNFENWGRKTLETLNPLTFASILEFGADPTGSFVQLECKEDFTGHSASSDEPKPI